MESGVSPLLRPYLSLCMVIPDYDVFPEECLSDMVRDVNEKTVKPQEILSDHVYYYHRESGELTLCEEET